MLQSTLLVVGGTNEIVLYLYQSGYTSLCQIPEVLKVSKEYLCTLASAMYFC
jgi:hypothetical protein